MISARAVDMTDLKVLVHTGVGGRLFTEVRLFGITKAEGEDGLVLLAQQLFLHNGSVSRPCVS